MRDVQPKPEVSQREKNEKLGYGSLGMVSVQVNSQPNNFNTIFDDLLDPHAPAGLTFPRADIERREELQ